MNTKKLSAGDIIDARCTRCRSVLNHRIVAMVGDKVVRVECNTCGGTHNYYPPPSVKTARSTGSSSSTGTAQAKKPAAAPRAPKKDQATIEQEEWNALRNTINPDKAVTYSMNTAFRKDDIVNHPVFGLGIVRQITGPSKMLVLFEDGMKLLRCK